MLRSEGDALQLDLSAAGAVVGAANIHRAVREFVRYRQPGSRVSVSDDIGLHHLLRHDDIPVPARAVSAFPVAVADGPERLPAGPGAGCGGVCAGDMDGMEEQWPGFG